MKWEKRLQLGAVFASLFANALTMTLPFAFLPFMIKDFGYERDEDVGYYAGILASSLFFGRALGSYPLGLLLDRLGRRPVMITSLTLISTFTLLFGFSFNFYVAVVVRFFSGFTNVVAAGAKTCISELCDPQLQSKMMTFLTIAWGAGLIAGSAFGGLLCQPADKYAAMDISLFRKFPYLLPCFVVSLCSFGATSLVVAFLPETLNKSSSGDDDELMVEKSTNDNKNKGLFWLLNQPIIVRLLLLYGIFSFSAIALEELFSVFFATPVELGGLGWTSSQIGQTMMVVGLLMTLCQYPIYSYLDRKFKALGVMKLSCFMVAVCTVLHPCLNWIQRSVVHDDVIVITNTTLTESSLSGNNTSSHLSPTIFMASILVAIAFKVSGGCFFSSISILMNNSVYSQQRGQLNGLGMTCTALFRTLGPSIVGSLFSWSITGSKPFPFNAFFAFFFTAAVFVMTALLATPLPKSLNLPKNHEQQSLKQEIAVSTNDESFNSS